MLSSPENEILAKACDALYKFASKGQSFCNELCFALISFQQQFTILQFLSIEIFLSPQRCRSFGGFSEISVQLVLAVIKKSCSLHQGNFYNFVGELCLIELVLNITQICFFYEQLICSWERILFICYSLKLLYQCRNFKLQLSMKRTSQLFSVIFTQSCYVGISVQVIHWRLLSLLYQAYFCISWESNKSLRFQIFQNSLYNPQLNIMFKVLRRQTTVYQRLKFMQHIIS